MKEKDRLLERYHQCEERMAQLVEKLEVAQSSREKDKLNNELTNAEFELDMLAKAIDEADRTAA